MTVIGKVNKILLWSATENDARIILQAVLSAINSVFLLPLFTPEFDRLTGSFATRVSCRRGSRRDKVIEAAISR